MKPEQREFYILGLKDAIKELEAEIDSCRIEFSGEARGATVYALRNGIFLIRGVIDATELGL